MNTSLRIMLDADGVLSDFEARVEEILGKPIDQVEKKRVWSGIGYYNKEVQPFYATLPKMADADVLWNFVVGNFSNVEILTATGYTPKDAGEQKQKWFAEHYGDVKVNLVVKSPDKAKWANPSTILVDDRSKSIDPFVAAGGVGILHTSAEATIEQLKSFL